MKKEILRMENVITEDIDKTNLDNFNIHVFQGEIMGLIGVNDYGKEVLIDLICNNTPIKFGRIYFANVLVNSFRYSDGSGNKVYVIGQESRLVNDLTITDNIFVLRKGLKKYVISKKVLESQLEQLMKKLDVSIDSKALCHDLSEYERCVAEILKAVIQGVKLIVVNDLSNILSAVDMQNYMSLLVKMAKNNYSILYMGNHPEEIFPICDRVAFMQNGKVIKVMDKKEMAHKRIQPYTIAFENNQTADCCENKERIYFRNLCTTYLEKISFSVQRGECVVLYDKSSKLQLDIVNFLSGERNSISGIIEFGNQVHNLKKVEKHFESQIAVIGKDAIQSMLFYNMSYIDNMCFLLDKKIHSSNITWKVKKSIQGEYHKELGDEVYALDLRKLDKKSLYNLIYYRIHLLNPKIVFIVQPFSNADMYLRLHIIQLIRVLKKKGIAVVILAVSISDSLHVAEKFLLLEEGVIKEEYLRDDFNRIVINN